jgi:hypothetical protein
MLGVVGATTGGLLFSAAAAQAAITPTGLGQLALNPASGATTASPTWSTTTACPAGNNTSAVLFALNSDGTLGSSISPTVPTVTAPFSGTLLGNSSLASIISLSTNVTAGGTSEFVVECFNGTGGTGAGVFVQAIFVHLDATGANYTSDTTAPAGPVNTTTAVSFSTNTPAPGANLTAKATVTAASGTTVPAGTVQFTQGSPATNIGTPVQVDATGVATSIPFAAPATAGTVVSVSAVFTPTSATAFNTSNGSASFTVVGSNGPFPIPVTFSVGATGAFTFTATTTAVPLTVDATNTTGTGNLNGNAITVSDTRNTTPGWQVTGQESDFAGVTGGTAAGFTISGNQLGWAPTDTALGTGVTLGPTVPPGAPGLGTTAGVLASAHAGSGTGTSNLSANLTLAIPAAQHAGAYAGTLTLTAVQSLP